MIKYPDVLPAEIPDEGLRLLLDPYLCFAPGSEHHADTLAAIARDAAALGLALCVEQKSWDEAATDPDVLRRRVALWRFEPLLKIPELPLPSKRDQKARFVPVRVDLSPGADVRRGNELLASYNQHGLPLVVMHGSDGEEADRVTGFIDAEEMLEKLRSVD